MSTGHRKTNTFSVFKLCRNFLATSNKETASVGTASPSSIPMTSLELPPHEPVTSSTRSLAASFTTNDWLSAVAQNDVRAVRYFLSQGADVNAPCTESGWSALHISAWNGYIDVTQLLLESCHCQVDLPGPGSVTPVILAVQQRHIHVVELLLGAGCDVTVRVTLRMRGGRCGHVASDVTALHVAAQVGHSGVVRRILAAGAPVNAGMSAGELGSVTPLHLAVEAGHSDVVTLLIEAGSDVNGRTTTSTSTSPSTLVCSLHSRCASLCSTV